MPHCVLLVLTLALAFMAIDDGAENASRQLIPERVEFYGLFAAASWVGRKLLLATRRLRSSRSAFSQLSSRLRWRVKFRSSKATGSRKGDQAPDRLLCLSLRLGGGLGNGHALYELVEGS